MKVLENVNHDIIRKWYEWLTDGYRKQTTGVLKNHDGSQCCLGVLCDVVGSGEWVKDKASVVYRSLEDSRQQGFAYLPSFVSDAVAGGREEALNAWAVDDSFDRGYPPDDDYYNLVLRVPDAEEFDILLRGALVRADALNDAHGFTFIQIAACVKETWPEAFGG